MNIVLDTNVFISGIFFSGPPKKILQAWQDGAFQIVITKKIPAEYRRVGEILSLQFPAIQLQPLFDFITIHTEVVPDQDLPGPVCDDPDDDKFIACALAGRSKIIVSGDKHLLKVTGFRRIEIVTPRNFTDTYLSKSYGR